MKKFYPASVKCLKEGCRCNFPSIDRDKLAYVVGKDGVPVLRLVQESGNVSPFVISSASEPGLEHTATPHLYVSYSSHFRAQLT